MGSDPRMANCEGLEDQQKTQMNTALYAGHTDNRAPAGLAPLLGGQAGGGLAENTMAHVHLEERQAAVENIAAQMVWNLTVRAESEALKVIGGNYGGSTQAVRIFCNNFQILKANTHQAWCISMDNYAMAFQKKRYHENQYNADMQAEYEQQEMKDASGGNSETTKKNPSDSLEESEDWEKQMTALSAAERAAETVIAAHMDDAAVDQQPKDKWPILEVSHPKVGKTVIAAHIDDAAVDQQPKDEWPILEISHPKVGKPEVSMAAGSGAHGYTAKRDVALPSRDRRQGGRGGQIAKNSTKVNMYEYESAGSKQSNQQAKARASTTANIKKAIHQPRPAETPKFCSNTPPSTPEKTALKVDGSKKKQVNTPVRNYWDDLPAEKKEGGKQAKPGAEASRNIPPTEKLPDKEEAANDGWEEGWEDARFEAVEAALNSISVGKVEKKKKNNKKKEKKKVRAEVAAEAAVKVMAAVALAKKEAGAPAAAPLAAATAAAAAAPIAAATALTNTQERSKISDTVRSVAAVGVETRTALGTVMQPTLPNAFGATPVSRMGLGGGGQRVDFSVTKLNQTAGLSGGVRTSAKESDETDVQEAGAAKNEYSVTQLGARGAKPTKKKNTDSPKPAKSSGADEIADYRRLLGQSVFNRTDDRDDTSSITGSSNSKSQGGKLSKCGFREWVKNDVNSWQERHLQPKQLSKPWFPTLTVSDADTLYSELERQKRNMLAASDITAAPSGLPLCATEGGENKVKVEIRGFMEENVRLQNNRNTAPTVMQGLKALEEVYGCEVLQRNQAQISRAPDLADESQRSLPIVTTCVATTYMNKNLVAAWDNRDFSAESPIGKLYDKDSNTLRLPLGASEVRLSMTPVLTPAYAAEHVLTIRVTDNQARQPWKNNAGLSKMLQLLASAGNTQAQAESLLRGMLRLQRAPVNRVMIQSKISVLVSDFNKPGKYVNRDVEAEWTQAYDIKVVMEAGWSTDEMYATYNLWAGAPPKEEGAGTFCLRVMLEARAEAVHRNPEQREEAYPNQSQHQTIANHPAVQIAFSGSGKVTMNSLLPDEIRPDSQLCLDDVAGVWDKSLRESKYNHLSPDKNFGYRIAGSTGGRMKESKLVLIATSPIARSALARALRIGQRNPDDPNGLHPWPHCDRKGNRAHPAWKDCVITVGKAFLESSGVMCGFETAPEQKLTRREKIDAGLDEPTDSKAMLPNERRLQAFSIYDLLASHHYTEQQCDMCGSTKDGGTYINSSSDSRICHTCIGLSLAHMAADSPKNTIKKSECMTCGKKNILGVKDEHQHKCGSCWLQTAATVPENSYPAVLGVDKVAASGEPLTAVLWEEALRALAGLMGHRCVEQSENMDGFAIKCTECMNQRPPVESPAEDGLTGKCVECANEMHQDGQDQLDVDEIDTMQNCSECQNWAACNRGREQDWDDESKYCTTCRNKGTCGKCGTYTMVSDEMGLEELYCGQCQFQGNCTGCETPGILLWDTGESAYCQECWFRQACHSCQKTNTGKRDQEDGQFYCTECWDQSVTCVTCAKTTKYRHGITSRDCFYCKKCYHAGPDFQAHPLQSQH